MGVWSRLREAKAVEQARVLLRADQLIAEADPSSTTELIEEWESYLGLPECGDFASNIIGRRFAVFSKWIERGGSATPAYFVALAESLGYTIEVEEILPFVVDRATVETPLYNDPWQYVWRVHAPAFSPTFFAAGEGVAGDPLVGTGNEILECAIEKRKPASTLVFFVFDLPYTGYSPWEFFEPPPTVLSFRAPLAAPFVPVEIL